MSKSRKTEKTESENSDMQFVERQKKSEVKREESEKDQKKPGSRQEESEKDQKKFRKSQEEYQSNQKASGVIQEGSETKQQGRRTEKIPKAAGPQNTEQSAETQEKKKKRGFAGKAKWIVLAVVLVLVIALPAGYIGIAMYYRTHFFPGSTVNGINCGNMTAAEAAPLVDEQINTYCLQVWGRQYATGESSILVGEIMPEDISLSYADSLGGVENILEAQNEWRWLQGRLTKAVYGHSLVQGVVFDEDKLKETVSGWTGCMKKNMLKPRDAYISDYSEEIGGYRIIPETVSTTLDMDKVLEVIMNAIYMNETAVDLEQELCYLEAKIRRTDAKLTEYVDSANTWLGTEITYDWNGNEVVVDLEVLKEWIAMEPNGPVLDEEAVRDFVKKQARKYNTIGKNKNFRTALGIELKLNSPNYGWKTDTDAETQELIRLIYEGSKTDREPVYSVMAREKGSNDIGGDYIEADLTHQHLYVYQDGQIAFETDFVSGKMNTEPSCATPPGIFGLTYKTRNATLRGADYESFVNYWMPFFGNYGMHDATWRRDFGGTIFLDHGSHGCINLPLDAAAIIYEYVSTGFPVICYYYEVDPLGPPDESQMPSEEELLMQEEPVLGQETQNPDAGAEQNPGTEAPQEPWTEQNPGTEASQESWTEQNPGTETPQEP